MLLLRGIVVPLVRTFFANGFFTLYITKSRRLASCSPLCCCQSGVRIQDIRYVLGVISISITGVSTVPTSPPAVPALFPTLLVPSSASPPRAPILSPVAPMLSPTLLVPCTTGALNAQTSPPDPPFIPSKLPAAQ